MVKHINTIDVIEIDECNCSELTLRYLNSFPNSKYSIHIIGAQWLWYQDTNTCTVEIEFLN